MSDQQDQAKKLFKLAIVKGHWRTTKSGGTSFVSTRWNRTPSAEEQDEMDAQSKAHMERLKKQKRSEAAKKAWVTIRKKKAEKEEAEKNKKKYRSIDDE